MGGFAGIAQGIGRSASDIARGILEARGAKEQRETRATELKMRTAKRSVGQPIFGADGKWRQIVEDPMTGQRTVEEVVGLPAAPAEYKGLHINPNTGDAYAVMVSSAGGAPKLEKVMTGADPAKWTAEAYKVIEGITNKEVYATAKRAVDSAIALGNYPDAYSAARKSLESFQQSIQITSRVGIRAESERKLRAEEAPGLVAQGILTPQEAQAYIAFGKSAVPRVYQTVGIEMQQRVNEVTGQLETIPVPVYRTTTSGISTGGRIAAPTAGRGVAPSAGGVQPPRRAAPPPAPNRQVRYPENVKAELARIDKEIGRREVLLLALRVHPVQDQIGFPDPAATAARTKELQGEIADYKKQRDTIVGNVLGVMPSQIDLTKPIQVQQPTVRTLPIAAFMQTMGLTPEERRAISSLPDGGAFKKNGKLWRKQGSSIIAAE